MARPLKNKKRLDQPIYLRVSEEAKTWLTIQAAKAKLAKAQNKDTDNFTVSDFIRNALSQLGMPE